MKFKLWSQSKPEVKEIIKPRFSLRSWNDLEGGEKAKIWHFLKYYIGSSSEHSGDIEYAIILLNEECKYQAYAKKYLEKGNIESAKLDFEDIFFNEDENVVIELISYYCEALLLRGESKNHIYKWEKESKVDFEKRNIEHCHRFFDQFAKRLNDIFEQFSINLYLTRLGFVMRQDPKITEEIFVPVVRYLTNPDFKGISNELSKAFEKYNNKTPSGYSDCITHSVSAIEAYLQTVIYGKLGKKGSLGALINKGIKDGKIPNDSFSVDIFGILKTFFASKRKNESGVHPGSKLSDEKTARLVLNLTMVFLQHCIQLK